MKLPPLRQGDRAVVLHLDQVIHGKVVGFAQGQVIFVTPDEHRWWLPPHLVVPVPERKQ